MASFDSCSICIVYVKRLFAIICYSSIVYIIIESVWALNMYTYSVTYSIQHPAPIYEISAPIATSYLFNWKIERNFADKQLNLT